MAKRLRSYRYRMIVVPILVILTALWLFGAPEPRLIGGFSLPTPPPEGETTAFASVDLLISSPLRFLVIVEGVDFVDASGLYVEEDAWIIQEGGGCAVFARGIDEIGRFTLLSPLGYRVVSPRLPVMFRIGIAERVMDYASPQGRYRVMVRLRFMGRRYVRTVDWVP